MIVQARKLQAPFPWFGGKSQVAHIVWERFGNVPNYVEPFFGRTAWRARRGGRWRAGCGEVGDERPSPQSIPSAPRIAWRTQADRLMARRRLFDLETVRAALVKRSAQEVADEC